MRGVIFIVVGYRNVTVIREYDDSANDVEFKIKFGEYFPVFSRSPWGDFVPFLCYTHDSFSCYLVSEYTTRVDYLEEKYI